MIQDFQDLLSDIEKMSLSQEAHLSGNHEAIDVPQMLRWILKKGIEFAKSKNLSRHNIADRMSLILGLEKSKRVTKTMMDKWTRDENPVRFPLEFTHAFCIAAGDNRLACLVPHMLGLKVLENEKTLRLKLEKTELIMMAAKKYKKTIEEQLSELENSNNVIPIFRMEA